MPNLIEFGEPNMDIISEENDENLLDIVDDLKELAGSEILGKSSSSSSEPHSEKSIPEFVGIENQESIGIYCMDKSRFFYEPLKLEKEKSLEKEMAASFIDPPPLGDGDIELELIEYRFTPGEQPGYWFKIHDVKTREKAGTINLIVGYSEQEYYFYGNIGYSVKERFRGHGYAEKAVKLMIEFARINRMPELFIMSNPDNYASEKTALYSGFSYIDTIAVPENHHLYRMGDRYSSRFRLKLNYD